MPAENGVVNMSTFERTQHEIYAGLTGAKRMIARGNHHPLDEANVERALGERIRQRSLSYLDLFQLWWCGGGLRSLSKPVRLALGRCRCCGQELRYETLNDQEWTPVTSCDAEQTLPPLTANIRISSNEMVFFSDPSPIHGMDSHAWLKCEQRLLTDRSADSYYGMKKLLELYALEHVLRLPVRSHASLQTGTQPGVWTLENPGLKNLAKYQPGRQTVVSGHHLLFCADAQIANVFPAHFATAVRVPCKPGLYRLTINPDAYLGEALLSPIYAWLERVCD